jgi:dynein light chain LC8-type
MSTPADAAAVEKAALIAALPKAVVLQSSMAADVLQRVTELTAEALVTHKAEKDQAALVKKALEAWNGSLWHVIIGTSFGASVMHDTKSLTIFRIGRVHALVFESFDDNALLGGEKKAVKAAKKQEDEKEETGGD